MNEKEVAHFFFDTVYPHSLEGAETCLCLCLYQSLALLFFSFSLSEQGEITDWQILWLLLMTLFDEVTDQKKSLL